MNIETRKSSFIELGRKLGELCSDYSNNQEFLRIATMAKAQNQWFTLDSIINALQGIEKMLQADELEQWLSAYSFSTTSTNKKVGVVMAGNIPLVGFHDFLCVLLAGHQAIVKLSSKDKVLMRYVAELLYGINADFKKSIHFEENQLKQFDAVIATGSNNSAKYFEFYFQKYPHIIRKNRTSVAILFGDETPEQIKNLGKDIFMYFGLGCRNVSKLYLPNDFEIKRLFEPLEEYSAIVNHNKYCNNYEYNKSIYLINRTVHFDNGFLLVKEDSDFFSPLGVLHFEKYQDIYSVQQQLEKNKENIQCIVSTKNIFFKSNVEVGSAQFPCVTDYADDIDTMQFLSIL